MISPHPSATAPQFFSSSSQVFGSAGVRRNDIGASRALATLAAVTGRAARSLAVATLASRRWGRRRSRQAMRGGQDSRREGCPEEGGS